MMIGPLIMGTISASNFSGYTATPLPMYLDGSWWSFTRTSREAAPSVGILSEVSIDLGASWSEDNEQFHTSFIVGTEDVGLGIAGGAQGSFVNHKDLAASGNDWIFTAVSSIAGGYIGGGINLLHFADTVNLFILNKSQGRDLYTSTDLVTYTPVNGGVENDLTLNNRLAGADIIVHADGQYVAHGIKSTDPTVFGTASSSDLLTWAAQPTATPQFFTFSFFNGNFYALAKQVGSGNVTQLWRSTNFIDWTQVILPQLTVLGDSISMVLIQNARIHLILDNQIMESTDGTTFTSHTKLFNIYSYIGTEPFPIYGKKALTSKATPPADILMRSTSIDEHGGKLLAWSGSLANNPTLRYPATSVTNATVGFVGDASNDVKGITGGGFVALGGNLSFQHRQGFYLYNTGLRYFEYEVLEVGTNSNGPVMGLLIPGVTSGSGLNYVFLVDNPPFATVRTSSGDLPITYTIAIGQVIGFLVNFITSSIEIFVDNTLLITLPAIDTAGLWTQEVNSADGRIKMNIGQDPFKYPQVGALAWAVSYL